MWEATVNAREFRAMADRCRDLQRLATDDGMREQLRQWAADLDAEAKAVEQARDYSMDPERDHETRKDFTQRVTLQLGDLARKGKVQRIGKGRSLRWKLV